MLDDKDGWTAGEGTLAKGGLNTKRKQETERERGGCGARVRSHRDGGYGERGRVSPVVGFGWPPAS